MADPLQLRLVDRADIAKEKIAKLCSDSFAQGVASVPASGAAAAQDQIAKDR